MDQEHTIVKKVPWHSKHSVDYS